MKQYTVKMVLEMPEQWRSMIEIAAVEEGLASGEDYVRKLIVQSPELYDIWKKTGRFQLPEIRVAQMTEHIKCPTRYTPIPLKFKFGEPPPERIRKVPPLHLWGQPEHNDDE